ncbi:hypothetical protein AMS68_003379 [Peltaster fructicola]|uniref:CDC45-like protein n=1 Tax=Peltaster fructicola TaxID=286661 RepID=A0A6H0XSW1_9PEZI|nr:hypothetical protein AMS68_003379 [Peltaster fructicola]
MHLPRGQIAQLYEQLQRNTHPLSPPVLILTALNVDALCATRIFTALMKRDYIQHKVQPISGYSDLRKAGLELVLPLTKQRSGDGGVVICLGVGGMVDLEEILGLDGTAEDSPSTDMSDHGVEVWVIDSRRPWNLTNVFGVGAIPQEEDGSRSSQRKGVDQGRVLPTYDIGRGGVIVWDDGGVEEELHAERDAYMALLDMPDITEDDLDLEMTADDADSDSHSHTHSPSRKRKASNEHSDDELEDADDERPHRRRRRNSSSSIPASPRPTSGQIVHSTPPPSSQLQPSDAVLPSSPPAQPTARQLRRKLLKLRRKHEATLEAYYGLEDNELLWLAIVGISSLDLSPLTQTKTSRDAQGHKLPDRAEQIREVLRDEVRRLNPVPEADIQRSRSQTDIMPSRARSPTDYAIRLSPEPRFMLIRHWSLIDSMMHSTYLSTRLHIWSDSGKQRLHKLLAKMGISLQEAAKSYVHMDMELKQSLRKRILKFAPQYNLDGLVPGEDGRRGHQGWGFVRSWGWKATFSAMDVAIIASAMLEVGPETKSILDMRFDRGGADPSYSNRIRALPTPPASDNDMDQTASEEGPDWTTRRFYAAYDALSPVSSSAQQGPSLLTQHISTAQHLARAILRCGAALMAKNQIRHLRSFRLAVVKEGPDLSTFVHPGALVKLAAWVSEAVQVLEAEQGRRSRPDEALVLGCLDESRGAYLVVGLGGAGARKKVRTKAEIRQREEKRKRKEADKIAKKAERARKREERKRLQRERDEANGILDSDAEDDESDATESEASDSSEGSDVESDEELLEARKQRGHGLNRFGQAFQEVIEQTAARVRIDSFEHSVVEVRKEDLSGFLESLSTKAVVG